MFAIVDVGDGPGSVSLKCDPGYAVALREQYPAVTPATTSTSGTGTRLISNGSVPDELLAEWIQDSYDAGGCGPSPG